VSNVDQLEFVGWVLLGFLLGGLIGVEREYRGRDAGVRTSALVCGAAAAFGQLGDIFGDSRLQAAVIQGVGFLGAGVIFQRRGDVVGVTTAATIWAAAAIGLVVGAELWIAALFVTAAVVALLELAPVSLWLDRHGREQHEHAYQKRAEALDEEEGEHDSPEAE